MYPQAGGGNQSSKEEQGTYGVTRHVMHSEEGPGRVRRVTAAVVVNDRQVMDGTGKAEHLVWKPRTAEEMKRFEGLAQAAVGFDEKRGDDVVMSNVSFSSNAPGGDAACDDSFDGRGDWLPPHGACAAAHGDDGACGVWGGDVCAEAGGKRGHGGNPGAGVAGLGVEPWNGGAGGHGHAPGVWVASVRRPEAGSCLRVRLSRFCRNGNDRRSRRRRCSTMFRIRSRESLHRARVCLKHGSVHRMGASNGDSSKRGTSVPCFFRRKQASATANIPGIA